MLNQLQSTIMLISIGQLMYRKGRTASGISKNQMQLFGITMLAVALTLNMNIQIKFLHKANSILSMEYYSRGCIVALYAPPPWSSETMLILWHFFCSFRWVMLLFAFWWRNGSNRPFSIWPSRKNLETSKIGIFIAQILIITITQTWPLNICFWGWQMRWNYF